MLVEIEDGSLVDITQLAKIEGIEGVAETAQAAI